MRPFREGFQTTTPQITTDPANNPNTCAIVLAVKEQLELNLKKATAASSQAEIDRTTQSIAAVNDELEKFKCN